MTIFNLFQEFPITSKIFTIIYISLSEIKNILSISKNLKIQKISQRPNSFYQSRKDLNPAHPRILGLGARIPELESSERYMSRMERRLYVYKFDSPYRIFKRSSIAINRLETILKNRAAVPFLLFFFSNDNRYEAIHETIY